MTRFKQLRPSPSMAVASIALLVALSGSAVAAVRLAKNSVRSAQIAPGAVATSDLAKNAVISSKVKNGSLLAADFAAGQLPAGAKGDPGARGPSSALQARQSGVVTLTGADQTALSLSLPAAGTYLVTARAKIFSENNPPTATCDSTKRGGAQMTLNVGSTQIDTSLNTLNPDFIVLGANCVAGTTWTQTTVVTTAAAATVAILAGNPLSSALTSNSISGAVIVAVQVASATGATPIP